MKRFLLAAAFVLPLTLGGQVRADDKKADVIVKDGIKIVKAQVGQSIELQLPNTPPPEANDIKVTVDGDAIDKTTDKVAKVVKEGGKPVSGKGKAAVIIKAKAAGKSHVKVEFKAGGDSHTREYDVEVAK
jgi:hypothetical protein